MIKRILAIDYGDKKVGTAYTDALGITIQPYKTIFTKNSDKVAISKIKEIVKEKDIKIIVIGMPYNTDGSEGERAEKTKQFIKKLKKNFKYSGLEDIEFNICDERYTSIMADEALLNMEVSQKRGKAFQDSLAAYYILDTFLKQKGN